MKFFVKLGLFSILFTVATASVTTEAMACGNGPNDGFLPPNDLYIPPRRMIYDRNGVPMGPGLALNEFNGIIDSVERYYGPIVQQMGADLVIERNWNDGTVNAYASRPNRNEWHVAMFGGLARHEETTIDAFLLVVCHELGHHIGGAPKYDRGNPDEWAGNEGESDYFATLKCARRVLEKEDNVGEIAARKIPYFVRNRCEAAFRDPNEAAICMRSAMGGLALSRLLASISSQNLPEDQMPWFTKRDTKKVTEMYDGHPAAQCRLDTYYSGAVCPIDFRLDVDQRDPTVNTCANELGYGFSARPRCWYLPQAKKKDPSTRKSRPAPSQSVYY